jgi:hypothetical protein
MQGYDSERRIVLTFSRHVDTNVRVVVNVTLVREVGTINSGGRIDGRINSKI